mmetsp:Transcript_7282/g.10241  ORF Transcript_7282/g.10241 Transcript_7282/m.10241 type:complete len:94 (+) Transcript_7282:247-528(+)
MYTQIADPEKADSFESFSCQAVYREGQLFSNEITVRNYYGPARFSELKQEEDIVIPGSNTMGWDSMSVEGLMYDQYAVWKKDTVNPQSSYQTR